MKNIILLIIPTLVLFSCFGTKKTSTNPKVEIVTQEQSQDTNTVFMVVEQMPEYPGGIDSMTAYLGRTINYPEEARKKEIEGKVYVQFDVSRSGVVKNVNIVRGLGHGCDEVAKSAVENMPVWTPGKQRGKPVNVRMVLPINFTLKKKKETPQRWEDNIHVEMPNHEIYNDKVEKPAKFNSDKDGMNKFIYSNLNYPIEAKNQKREGRTTLSFFVETDGSLSDIKIVRGIGLGCDIEAKRIVESMPNWIPAEDKGKKVKVKVFIQIEFNLD